MCVTKLRTRVKLKRSYVRVHWGVERAMEGRRQCRDSRTHVLVERWVADIQSADRRFHLCYYRMGSIPQECHYCKETLSCEKLQMVAGGLAASRKKLTLCSVLSKQCSCLSSVRCLSAMKTTNTLPHVHNITSGCQVDRCTYGCGLVNPYQSNYGHITKGG